MKGGKVADDMCPILGVSTNSSVLVDFMKTVKFYTFPTCDIKKFEYFPLE